MKLDNLLKVSNVRCIKTKADEGLVEGEVYKVEGFNDETIKIVDRNGFSDWHNENLFEPVLNNDIDLDELVNHLAVGKSWKEVGCNHVVTITEIDSGFANNIMVVFESDCCLSSSPLGMFLKDFTPVINNDVSKSNSEIDISLDSVDTINTKFKVGDKVYLPNIAEGEVLTLLDNKDCHYPFFVNVINRVDNSLYVLDSDGKTKHGNFTDVVLKATQENYEMLCKLYPHIKFEQPPKPLTGNDLTKGMFERGDFAVVCKCSDTSEIMAIAMSPLRLIVGYNDGYFEENNGKFWKFAIPYDPKTEIPLTEDVLNETI